MRAPVITVPSTICFSFLPGDRWGALGAIDGTDLERLQGERDTTHFIDACVRNAGGNVRGCAAHRFPMGVATVENAALRRRKNQASLKREANLGLSAKLPRHEPRPENLPHEKQVREQGAEMDRGIEIVD